MKIAPKRITGADIRAERNRVQPPINQQELAEKVGFTRQHLTLVENGHFAFAQEEYQRILDAIAGIAKERGQA